MSATLYGLRKWTGSRDAEGYREYKITQRVVTSDANDGPLVAMTCPGLPLPGAVWAVGNDLDVWAWCRPDREVEFAQEIKEGSRGFQWDVTSTFSSKPVPASQQRCNTTEITDPILEPPKVNGSFVQFTEEGVCDRFGNQIVNSAFERIRGPLNEWEANRTGVEIEQNVVDLELPLLSYIQNNPLNRDYMWGVIPRGIKVSVLPWERRFYGNCYAYYTRKFRFDVNVRQDPVTGNLVSGWDRDIQDEGMKALAGHWDTDAGSTTYGQYVLDPSLVGGVTPDPSNPQHFIKFQDPLGNYASVPLDGAGMPAGGYTTSGNKGPWLISVVAGTVHVDPGDTQQYDKWVATKQNPASTPPSWTASSTYVRGALVAVAGVKYVCTYSGRNGTSSNPGTNPDKWQVLVTLTDRSPYDITQFDTYNLGDYVSQDVKVPVGVGTRHVEKYGESNLFLLNVPLSF